MVSEGQGGRDQPAPHPVAQGLRGKQLCRDRTSGKAGRQGKPSVCWAGGEGQVQE